MFLVGGGDSQASVTWLTPASDGGSAIISYTVTSSPGSFTCTTPDGATNTCVVTGLTNGVAYTFTVTARNILGVGPASAPSDPITPRPAPVAPDAPTGVTGVAGDGQVTVSWLAPANNGGSVVEGYQIQVATSAAGVYADASGGCAPATTSSSNWLDCQATGLVYGQTYFFKVRAQNAVNWGPYSLASSSVTPIAPPAPPAPPAPSPGGGSSGGGGDVVVPNTAQPPITVPVKDAPAGNQASTTSQTSTGSVPPVAKSYTIRFANSSSRLTPRTKKILASIAKQSRQSNKATTVVSARLTPAGATAANRVLAGQRTARVCSYLQTVRLKGSCSTKTWILKPGKPGIGPNVVVRITLTPESKSPKTFD
jgi:hypothetical protein